MARFEHLPVYNRSFELTKACFRELEKMPRGHKKAIGDRIVNSSLRQTQIIVYANGAQNKEASLVKLILEIENKVLLLRVATDLKVLSLGEGLNMADLGS